LEYPNANVNRVGEQAGGTDEKRSYKLKGGQSMAKKFTGPQMTNKVGRSASVCRIKTKGKSGDRSGETKLGGSVSKKQGKRKKLLWKSPTSAKGGGSFETAWSGGGVKSRGTMQGPCRLTA